MSLLSHIMKRLTRLSLLCFFFLIAISAVGQKAFRPIRAALKAKKYGDAFGLVESLRKDSLIALDPQLYAYGVEASRRLNDIENEKIYLKRKPDTLAYFRTLYNIFDYALLTQQRAEATQWKRRAKTAKDHRELLNGLFGNMNAATLYFLAKNKMDELARFAQLGIEAAQSPLFSDVKANVSGLTLAEWAERLMLANYAQKRYKESLRYEELALTDTAKHEGIYESLALIYAELKQEERELFYLNAGLTAYPRNMFFFTHLADYYFQQQRYDSVVNVANTLLADNAESPVLWEYLAKAYDEQGRDSLCLGAAEQVLVLDSANVRANYYAGKSLLSQVQRIPLPTSIHSPHYKQAFQQRQCLYKKARLHVERFRQRRPDAASLWRPMLYEIYLKLNLGKEFEEVSQIKKQ